LRNQLVDAYDVYLEICRRVDAQIDKALNYDPSSRLARQCPACFAPAPDGKQTAPFSVLVTMDGNNSLKRISPAVRGHDQLPDSRQLAPERWLTAEVVDGFRIEDLAVCKSSDSEQQHLLTPFASTKTI
jgi:hypothetical protein